MSDTKITPTTGLVGTTPTEGQPAVPDKQVELKAPGKVAEKPGVEISGGDADGTSATAKKATELAGTNTASPTGSVLGQIAHRTGEAKAYLLVGIDDDSNYFGKEKREALEAVAAKYGTEPQEESGAIFGSWRMLTLDPKDAQKAAKEINALEGMFTVRANKIIDAPAMTGRAPAVSEWADKLENGSLPERIGAARRLLADLRAGKVGKDKEARDAIGDAVYHLLGPTVSLFNNVHEGVRRTLSEQLRATMPDESKIDWNAVHRQVGALMQDPANRTTFEPARNLTLELLETLDRLGTPRAQTFMMETFRHCDYAGYQYLRDNPASAKRMTTRWLGEVDKRFTNLKKYLSLSEEERKADDEWRVPSHSGGYENLPNLHRSALDATHGWSADFAVHDFPTDPGLLLSSPVAAHVTKGIEKLALRVDKEIAAMSKQAFDQQFNKEYEKIARMYREGNHEITPERDAQIRKQATESLRYDSFAHIDGLESLNRILGMLPYHARNSWNCPVDQDDVMSNAIDLHASLLNKVGSEQLGRTLIDGSLSLIAYAKRWGDDMQITDETRAKAGTLADAIVAFEHDPKAVDMAAYTLGKMKMPQALPLLRAGLRSDDPDVRKTSAEAIVKFGEGAVPAIELMPLLEDENSHWIQADAAYAVLAVAPEHFESANITLRSLLKPGGSHRFWSGDRQRSSARRDAQRTSVIEHLGHLGEAARPAAPVLAEHLDDPVSDYVRMAASITLLKIGAEEYTEAALATIRDLASEGGTIKWVGDDPENRLSGGAVAGSKDKDDAFRAQVLSELRRAGAGGQAALPLLREFAAPPLRTLPADISEAKKATVIAYKVVDYYARGDNLPETLEALQEKLADGERHAEEVQTVRAYVDTNGFESFQSLMRDYIDQIEFNQLSKNARDTIGQIERELS